MKRTIPLMAMFGTLGVAASSLYTAAESVATLDTFSAYMGMGWLVVAALWLGIVLTRWSL